ncbi:MAG: tRNA dihydrouridine synthase DusB [Endomicrobiaceae bacterium]|nr:tRNA dihydrouridine synthase DusB [Endomicrobiaceae bacterium]MDD3922394.1 tRNA dihydrouridine synthase DusB [Endomicrobiaceae bacterium]
MIKLPQLSIGNIKLKNSLMLAPMAGITDLPLRELAVEGGAGLVYTEMISATALVYGDKKTLKLLSTSENEPIVAAQIFGTQPEIMSECAKRIQDLGYKIIDINLGCPAKKIAKVGAGARLLANPKNVESLLSSVVKSVSIPVTAKIRIGLIEGQNIAPEIVEIAQNCGVKMLAIHARVAEHGHSGLPDLEAFEKATENAQIPIVANGGIIDIITAEKFLKISKCSGLMIGRGAIGDYDLFKRIECFFDKQELLPHTSIQTRLRWFKKHAIASAKYYGEEKGLIVLRKIAPYYIKGLPNACALRNRINKLVTLKEFDEIFSNIDSI